MGGHNMEIIKKPRTLHYSRQTMQNTDATATKVINLTNFRASRDSLQVPFNP